MTINIRPCTEDDLEGVAAIYNHAVQHTNAIWNDATVDVANRASGGRAASPPAIRC